MAANTPKKPKRKPWRKVLYANEEYDDNYTDPSFLQELTRNKFVRVISFPEAILGATKLTSQITIVILFMLLFYLLYKDHLRPETLMLQASGVTSLGYLYSIVAFPSRRRVQSLLHDSKTVLGVLVFGFLFTPLMHTLTTSISTDTIFSTTFIMMVLHLIFADYGLDAFMVSKAISLNAAIFATICLSSRLATTFHSFVLLTVAIEAFVLLPIFLKTALNSYWSYVPFVFCIVAGSAFLLYTFTIMPLLFTYLGVVGFVNVVCPVIFVRQQKFKDNKHGPWEEAIVKATDLQINSFLL